MYSLISRTNSLFRAIFYKTLEKKCKMNVLNYQRFFVRRFMQLERIKIQKHIEDQQTSIAFHNLNKMYYSYR